MARNYLQYQSLVEPPTQGTNNPALVVWRPKYPDHKLTRPELLAAIYAGSAFFIDIYTAAVSLDKGPAGGSGALFPGGTRQYLAKARPFDAALTPVTTTIEWVAASPDPLRRIWRPEGGAAWTPQHNPAEGSALDWTPKAPEWIAARPRTTEYPSFVLPQREQTIARAWAPIYPDQVLRPTIPTAFHQALASNTAPEQTISSAAWKTTYPDRVDRKTLPTAAIPSFQWGGSPSMFPVTEGWRPIYPDRLRPPTLAWHQAYAANIDPITAVVVVTYTTPSYPDLLPRILRTPASGSVDAPLVGAASPIVPGAYPDWLLRTTPVQLGGAVGSLKPEVTIPKAWDAVYPSWIARTTLLTADQQAFAQNLPPIVATPTYATPVYPDWIARRPQTWPGGGVFAPQPEVTAPKVWDAVYPNWIARSVLPTVDQQAIALISPSYFPVPPNAWEGVWPDFISRQIFPAAQQSTYTANVFPITGGAIIVYKFIVIVGD